MSPIDFIHPEDRESAKRQMEKRLSGEATPTFSEYRGVRKSGEIRWFEAVAASIDYEGEPALLGNLLDITDRKMAEEALRESEERYRQLFDSSISGIYVHQDGKVQLVNKSMAETVGYTKEELIGKPIVDFAHPDDRERSMERIRLRAMGEEVAERHYMRILTKDGEIIWAEATGVLIDYKGKPAVLSTLTDITDRKKAEGALRESEERYRELFNNSVTGIYVYQDGKLQLVNRRLVEMSGYSEEELICKPVMELIYPEDRKHTEERMKLRSSGAEILEQHRVRVVNKSGKIRWVETMGAIIDYQGRPAVLSTMSDITEQIKAEAAIEEERDKAQRYLDIANIMLIALDTKGNVVLINKKGCEVLGYDSEEEIIGKHWFENFLPEQERESTWEAFQRIMQGDVVSLEHYENHMLAKTGEERLIAWNNSILTDSDGAIIGTISSGEDITERKQLEEELLETKNYLEYIIENAHDIIYIFDADGNITYINRQAQEMLGYMPEDRIGKKIRQFIHPDDWGLNKDWAKGLRRGRPQQGEIRFSDKDGKYRTLSIHEAPVIRGGKYMGSFGIARDISEQKRLQKEADHRLQQIVQADKLTSLGEVVAGVAHEINNPNSFITYNVPLLEETWKIAEPILRESVEAGAVWNRSDMTFEELCEDMAEIIHAIKTGSERIRNVVTNLKDFARVDESIQHRPIRINEVIEKTMIIVGAQARKSVAKIDINLAEDLPEIQGHFQKLEQVVANLIVNAMNAIPEREKGRISIVTRYIERFDAILIEIEDNGAGVPPEVIGRVFEPFYSTRRESGGTGLGLSVSYGLVKEHRGIIGLLSTMGVGTRFTVYLPVDMDTRLSLYPSILCVDDNVQVLDMLKDFFLDVEDKIFEATSEPENVLEYLKDHPEVDIVLSDIMMPKLDGWELLQQIKEQYPLITVILYSGDPDALYRKPENAVDPDYLLKKPFEMKQLSKIIEAIPRQML